MMVFETWLCHVCLLGVIVYVQFIQCVMVNLRGLGQIQGFSQGSTSAYLGIPYAKPPIGHLRFMPPERHNGWNRTLDATNPGPNCLQPVARSQISEDCLYLNIWTPQQYGGIPNSRSLPVVIFIGGELFSFYDSSNVVANELTSYDLIFVTFNYRLGIFGFLSTEDLNGGGNMGLLDQHLAIEWIHENIREFGGDPLKVTLMGHSAGAASALYHMTSPRGGGGGRFHRIILMSGTSLAPWALGYKVKEASLQLAQELGCREKDTAALLTCLRFLDANRIAQTSYRISEVYNGTNIFGPIVDSFLPRDFQYVGRMPREALERGDFPRIPVISGISSKDGLLLIKRRSQLYRMTPIQLKETFEGSLIPELLERSGLSQNWLTLKEVIKFAFITGAANETDAILEQMLDFFTEAYFLGPHIQTAELLGRHSNPVYAYVFDQETLDPNIYTSSINVTGASHGSILLYLFGRSTFMDSIGREYSGAERTISSRIQELWINFCKSGIPSQARSNSWTTWSKYNPTEPFHFWLRDGRITDRGFQPYRTQFWTEFLPRLNEIGPASQLGSTLQYREGASPVYKSATWTLLGLVLLLLALIILIISAFRRRTKVNEFTSRETSPEMGGSRSPLPSPSPHPAIRTRRNDPSVTILY